MDPNIQKPIAHRGFAVREMILSVAARGSVRALGRILAKYATYYNQIRTHVSLGKDAPCTRPIERFEDIVAYPILGGLHRRYARI
jgi:hypothetical protein